MPKKQPARDRTPKVPPLDVVPKPPAELGSHGRDYWNKLAPLLIEAKILTALHLESFTVLCRVYDEYRNQSEYLRLHPDQMTFTTDTGYEQESPRVRIRDKALASMQRLWQKFGITPQALAQLNKHGGASGGKLSTVESFAASKYGKK